MHDDDPGRTIQGDAPPPRVPPLAPTALGEPREGLSVQEAAKRLGVSTDTIRAWIKTGKLRADEEPLPQGKKYRVYLDDRVDHAPHRLPPAPTAPTPASDDLAIERAILDEFARHELAVIPLLSRLRGTIRQQETTIAELTQDLHQTRALVVLLATLVAHQREQRPRPRPRRTDPHGDQQPTPAE